MNVLSLQFMMLAAVTCILLWILPKSWRPVLVGIGCACFLGMLSKPVHWIYALCLICYTWGMGELLKTHHDQRLFAGMIAIPVMGLCLFKYAGYFSNVSLITPLGLSFYTFKAISYLSDRYTGKLEQQNLLLVFDYLAFFPTFEAGPINRPAPFFEELKQPFHFDYQDQKNGAFQCACGIFEKLVIADELGYLANTIFQSHLTGWYLSLGMILYAFNLYADFDAYSNLAIGISRMMGFHLPANFHTPYLAHSLKDFWRRWHISLSSWLKDYVYIPLGGSHKGYLRKCINIVIVFLVSGFWHGSTAMFVLWGLGHGVIMVLEDLLRVQFGSKPWLKYLKIPAVLLNFFIVTALWALFRSPDLVTAGTILSSVFHPCSISWQAIGMTLNEYVWTFVLISIVIVTDLLRNRWNMIEGVAKCPWFVRWLLYAVMLVLFLIFANYGTAYNPSDFIYVTF